MTKIQEAVQEDLMGALRSIRELHIWIQSQKGNLHASDLEAPLLSTTQSICSALKSLHLLVEDR